MWRPVLHYLVNSKHRQKQSNLVFIQMCLTIASGFLFYCVSYSNVFYQMQKLTVAWCFITSKHLSYWESNLATCIKRHKNMHVFVQVIPFLEMF